MNSWLRLKYKFDIMHIQKIYQSNYRTYARRLQRSAPCPPAARPRGPYSAQKSPGTPPIDPFSDRP